MLLRINDGIFIVIAFDLDRVWSIRNDVAVVPTKIQYNKNNTYYSRHKKQVNGTLCGFLHQVRIDFWQIVLKDYGRF